MLYSKTQTQLIEKVDMLISKADKQYSDALSKWKLWYLSSAVSIPSLDEEGPEFYRAYFGGEEIMGVQIWIHDNENDINVWKHNFLMSGFHEDNTELTFINEGK